MGRPFGPPRSPFRPPVGLIRGRPPFAFRPGMPPPQRPPPGFSPSGIRTPPSRKGSLTADSSPRFTQSPPSQVNSLFERVPGGSRRSSQQPLLPTLGESSPVLESPEPYLTSSPEDHRQQQQQHFEDDLEWSTDRMGGYDSPTSLMRRHSGSTNLDNTDYRQQPTTTSSDPDPPHLHNDILSDQSWVTETEYCSFNGQCTVRFFLYIKQLSLFCL